MHVKAFCKLWNMLISHLGRKGWCLFHPQNRKPHKSHVNILSFYYEIRCRKYFPSLRMPCEWSLFDRILPYRNKEWKESRTNFLLFCWDVVNPHPLIVPQCPCKPSRSNDAPLSALRFGEEEGESHLDNARLCQPEWPILRGVCIHSRVKKYRRI